MSSERKAAEKMGDLKEKDLSASSAEQVKGGAGPIDAKKPPLSVAKPVGPIDG